MKELADPGLQRTIDMCEKLRLKTLEIGMELIDEMNVIQGPLELVWPARKVAIVIGDNNAEFALAHGGKVLTMIELLDKFTFFQCVR